MTYNWFMGGASSTYAGDCYLADEAAKGIVNELKLRDGDTVSKDQIIDYLAKQGIGPLWASDTAIVLRNMFGVTPIFFESYAGESIISDMGDVLNHPAEDPDLTEKDISTIYALAIEESFTDSADDEEDAIVAALSAESLETVALISTINNWLTEDQLLQFEAVWKAGGDSLVESWYDAVSRPHLIRLMDHGVVEAISEAIGMSPSELEEGFRSDLKAQRKQSADVERQTRARMATRAQGFSPGDDTGKLLRATQRNREAADREDPLASRAADSKNLLFRHQMNKSAGGFDRVLSGKAQNSKEGERQFVNKQMNTARSGMEKARENPAPLPSYTPPKPGMAKSALNALGHVMKGAGHLIHLGVKGASNKLDKMAQRPMQQPAEKPMAQRPEPAEAPAEPAERGKRLPASTAAEPAAGPSPGPAQTPEQPSTSEPMKKPSLASRVVGVAGRVAKGALGGVIGGLHGLATGKGVGGRLGGLVKGAIGGAAVGQAHGQEGGGSMRHLLRAKARIKAPGLMYALHGAPDRDELQAASHLGLHQHYANMGYDLNKVHDPKYGMQEPIAQAPQVKQRQQAQQRIKKPPRKGVTPPLEQGN